MPKQAPPRNNGKTQKQLIAEYLKREAALDAEIETLREAKKDLKEEFKDQIDLKVLAKAQRVVKARRSVEDKDEDTFQLMLEALDSDLKFQIALRQAS